jgi:hypothetical protein
MWSTPVMESHPPAPKHFNRDLSRIAISAFKHFEEVSFPEEQLPGEGVGEEHSEYGGSSRFFEWQSKAWDLDPLDQPPLYRDMVVLLPPS